MKIQKNLIFLINIGIIAGLVDFIGARVVSGFYHLPQGGNLLQWRATTGADHVLIFVIMGLFFAWDVARRHNEFRVIQALCDLLFIYGVEQVIWWYFAYYLVPNYTTSGLDTTIAPFWIVLVASIVLGKIFGAFSLRQVGVTTGLVFIAFLFWASVGFPTTIGFEQYFHNNWVNLLEIMQWVWACVAIAISSALFRVRPYKPSQ